MHTYEIRERIIFENLVSVYLIYVKLYHFGIWLFLISYQDT